MPIVDHLAEFLGQVAKTLDDFVADLFRFRQVVAGRAAAPPGWPRPGCAPCGRQPGRDSAARSRSSFFCAASACRAAAAAWSRFQEQAAARFFFGPGLFEQARRLVLFYRRQGCDAARPRGRPRLGPGRGCESSVEAWIPSLLKHGPGRADIWASSGNWRTKAVSRSLARRKVSAACVRWPRPACTTHRFRKVPASSDRPRGRRERARRAWPGPGEAYRAARWPSTRRGNARVRPPATPWSGPSWPGPF